MQLSWDFWTPCLAECCDVKSAVVTLLSMLIVSRCMYHAWHVMNYALYTSGYSDIILSVVFTATMLEVNYYVSTW